MAAPLGAAARNPFTLAERLLGVVSAGLDDNVPNSRPAPSHRYVAHGTPVLDYPDQLTVHLGSLYLASSLSGDSQGAATGPKLVVVDLVVTLVECHPTGLVQQGAKKVAVSADILTEASEQSYIDGWTAYHSAINGWGQCGNGTCDLYTISPLLPLDPEGGAAGWQFTLTADIGQPRTAL